MLMHVVRCHMLFQGCAKNNPRVLTVFIDVGYYPTNHVNSQATDSPIAPVKRQSSQVRAMKKGVGEERALCKVSW
jgi:hypothetical protein